MEKVIEVKDLEKYYAKVKALDGISFDVCEGEILRTFRTKWKW